MAKPLPPIPQNPIEESHVWREWFTAAQQNGSFLSNAVSSNVLTANGQGDLFVGWGTNGAGSLGSLPYYVDTQQLADAAVTSAKIGALEVNTSNINYGAIVQDLIASGAVGYTQFQTGLAPITIVTSLPTLPDPNFPIGTTISLTTDGNLYRNVSNTWTAAVDGGLITANTITASQIAAGSITSTQIAANTIVGGNIAAGTITAGNLVTATITAASAVIANAAVDTLQIAGNAVTVPVYGSVSTGAIVVTTTATTYLSYTVTIAGLAVGATCGLIVNHVSGIYPSTGFSYTIQGNILVDGVFASASGITISGNGLSLSGTGYATVGNGVHTIAIQYLTTAGGSWYGSFDIYSTATAGKR
jgi:hypothetical protein